MISVVEIAANSRRSQAGYARQEVVSTGRLIRKSGLGDRSYLSCYGFGLSCLDLPRPSHEKSTPLSHDHLLADRIHAHLQFGDGRVFASFLLW